MRIKLLFVVLSLCLTAAATSQHEVFNNDTPFYRVSLNGVNGLDLDKATLANPAAAKSLIDCMRAVQKQSANPAQHCPLSEEEEKQVEKGSPAPGGLPILNGKQPNSYVLIHLVRWADSTPDKPKVQANNWYLYRDVASGKWSQEDFTTAKRLQGVTRVYVLYVQFKGEQTGTDGKLIAPTSYVPSYTPDYDITITKKTPANVAHLYALLQAYTGGLSATQGQAAANKALEENAPPPPDAVWGGGLLNLQYRPSDILIKSTFKLSSGDSDQKLADDITFDNEGPYWWDVGFAVPVKKISELKLDSTSGTATPANVNGQNVFSVFDFYVRPVDVKGSGFMAYPHPIAGVAFAKQPLHKILLGGAWGPKASEIYAGALFVKQPDISGSNSCSNPSGTSFTGGGHWCTQFSVGINLSVSAIASKLGAPK